MKGTDKLSREEKLAMCVDRINGLTAKAIGEKYQRAPSMVIAVFRSLPCRYNSSSGIKPNMDDSSMIKVCELTYNGNTPAEIAKIMGTTSANVYRVYEYIKARRPAKYTSVYYPAVTDWMYANQTTLRDFASLVGIHPLKLGDILAGRRNQHLPYSLALSISSQTGLSFSDIFRVQLENEARCAEERA